MTDLIDEAAHQRLDGHDEFLDGMHARFDGIESRLGRVEDKVDLLLDHFGIPS